MAVLGAGWCCLWRGVAAVPAGWAWAGGDPAVPAATRRPISRYLTAPREAQGPRGGWRGVIDWRGRRRKRRLADSARTNRAEKFLGRPELTKLVVRHRGAEMVGERRGGPSTSRRESARPHAVGGRARGAEAEWSPATPNRD